MLWLLYSFNQHGEIIAESPRHYTGRNAGEIDRYNRIAVKSVFDYAEKNNRHSKSDLTKKEKIFLVLSAKKSILAKIMII